MPAKIRHGNSETRIDEGHHLVVENGPVHPRTVQEHHGRTGAPDPSHEDAARGAHRELLVVSVHLDLLGHLNP